MKHVIGLFIMTFLVANVFAADVVRVKSIDEILSRWTSQQQLYVCGEIGPKAKEEVLLDVAGDLQSWPNWTVVLYVSTSPDDASVVESSLRQGLFANPSFLQIKEERSGTANGCVLLIVFESKNQYQVTCLSSALQTENGFDAAKLSKMCDFYGIRYLQMGKSIREVINAPISAMEVELQVARSGKLLTDVQRETTVLDTIVHAKQALNVAKMKAQFIREVKPEAQGDLTHPNIDEMQSHIELASEALREDRLVEADRIAKELQTSVDSLSRSYSAFFSASSDINGLRIKIETLEAKALVDAPQLESAKKRLETAIDLLENADSAYLKHVDELSRIVGEAPTVADGYEEDGFEANLPQLGSGLGWSIALLILVTIFYGVNHYLPRGLILGAFNKRHS